MAIKDILVHLTGPDSGRSVVEAAVTMAARHEARLIGLFAGVPFEIPSYVVAQLPAEVIEAHQAHVKENAQETAALFEKICRNNGISHTTFSGDWRDQVEHLVSMHARYADMVMMAQPDEDHDGARAREIADHIVLSAGAPVILVPPRPAKTEMGNVVLVGWDGGPHAARAVRDALPILEKADTVEIMCVDPKPGLGGLGDLPGADLAQYLASHGVKAEAGHQSSAGVSVGSVLLNEATNIGADMIVTGGYGHSRLGEMILGGVTDTLMEHMTVPVLMSH